MSYYSPVLSCHWHSEPPEELGLAAELSELHEDVEEAEEEDEDEDNVIPTAVPTGMHSQVIGKVFVERKSEWN